MMPRILQGPPLAADPIVNADGTNGDDLIIEAHFVHGWGGKDTILGTAQSDQIFGYGFGSDMGFGIDGRDSIEGREGDDLLRGQAGGDLMDGGAGNDSLYGATSTRPVPGDGGDRLSGDTGDDLLRGNEGSDTVLGGDGNDDIAGNEGLDTVDGGAGFDVARFNLSFGTAAARFDAGWFERGITAEVKDGVGGRDLLIGIEALAIQGGGFNDTLRGSRFGDWLDGGDGDNRVEGRGGDDRLWDGAGGATLEGGDGDDLVEIAAAEIVPGLGGPGHDVVRGGDGFDQLTFKAIGGTDHTVTMALAATGTLGLSSDDDSLAVRGTGLEAVRFELSAFGEGRYDLTGGVNGDWLEGGGGDDLIRGGDGDDTLAGGWGEDLIDGGAGRDIYRFQDEDFTSEGQLIDASGFDVSGATFKLERTGYAHTLSGIDGVGLYGDYGDDTLVGSAGHDRLDGGEGADVIHGGAGDDVLIFDPGFGVETADGGDGFDSLNLTSFQVPRVRLRVDLRTGEIRADSGDGIASAGSVSNVEEVIGGVAADTLIGAAGKEALQGIDGDDVLSGGGGKDTLTGGLGTDFLTGGGGKDLFAYGDEADSGPGWADLIVGYGAGDRIDLRGVDADAGVAGDQAFVRVAAFSGAAGELTASYDSGVGETLVEGDVDGDAVADLAIRLSGDQTGDLSFVL